MVHRLLSSSSTSDCQLSVHSCFKISTCRGVSNFYLHVSQVREELWPSCTVLGLEITVLGPYAPQGSRKLPKWSRCSKSVLQTLIRTFEVRYSQSIGEVNSNRVTSSLLRKWTRFPTHACEVRALTFEVTDNFGSNGVLPRGAYRPWLAGRWTLIASPQSLSAEAVRFETELFCVLKSVSEAPLPLKFHWSKSLIHRNHKEFQGLPL